MRGLPKHMRILLLLLCLTAVGCKLGAPQLPDTQPMAISAGSTVYTKALQDLNLLMDVYYPPTARDVYFYVKPIRDSTNISAHTGEIPMDIADVVRAAFGDVHNKVRVLDHFEQTDATQALGARRNVADFVVAGSITMYDRGLESISRSPRAMASAGQGLSRIDASASIQKGSEKSHIGVTLRVSDGHGVSHPGRYGAEMDLWYAKDGLDVGFAIFGIGFGYASEGISIQGRHQALRLIADLSVVQIIGRTFALPYWRVPLNKSTYGKIYDEDDAIIRAWRSEYEGRLAASLSGVNNETSLIPHMQSACIANGDDSVLVNGRRDDPAFQDALTRFASQYNVGERINRNHPEYPGFEMFKALELNRALDSGRAQRAWRARATFNFAPRSATPPPQGTKQPNSGNKTEPPKNDEDFQQSLNKIF